MGASWSVLGGSWEALGASCGRLGTLLRSLGSLLGAFGSLLERLGFLFPESGCEGFYFSGLGGLGVGTERQIRGASAEHRGGIGGETGIMELDGGDGQIRSFRVSWERLLKRVLGVLGRVACGGLGELHPGVSPPSNNGL